MNTDPRIQALSRHLVCDVDDITPSAYIDNGFDANGKEWLVLTDAEADESSRARVTEDLWAFNASFVIAHCNLDDSDAVVRAFTKMQEELCEDATPFVRAIIEGTVGLERFVSDAINADGRGHFLSQYDGEEVEEKVGDEYFYLYRLN